MNMRVNFIVPNIPKKPVGGYKVMYQYANAFAENGHDVHLYHVATIKGISYNIPHWLRWLRTLIFFKNSKPSWFTLNDNIKTINIPYLTSTAIRKADYNFITMWAEVLEIAELDSSIGPCVNLIQGYETWVGTEEDVHKSFQTKAKNIVISKYLAEIVEKHTNHYPPIIPNPIGNEFIQITPIEERNPYSISMLYSTYECKGSEFGLEALNQAKKEIPELTVELFGIFSPPENLPQWIHYHRNPKDLNKIYNSVSIHVSPSVNDGWDLPCTEAMKCGCVLVCTNIAGHQEYAKDGLTALLAKPQSAESLAQKILEAMKDDSLREKLSYNGQKEVEKYTIYNSYQQLLKNIL